VAKKLYYRIGEACRELEIPPYVLRYWETEFSALRPDKSKAGQRVYSEETLAIIRRIKDLLYNEGYTIAGAKKRLEKELQDGAPSAPAEEKPAEEPARKPPARKRAKASAKEPKEAAERPPEEPSKVDTEASNRLKKLQAGVQEALASAKELRDLLN
jgi:DNA-binding transcriptional MerR regulator